MKNQLDPFAEIAIVLFLILASVIITASVVIDSKIEHEGSMVKYCETLQLADGTIVDRPCAPNEQPKNSVRAQQLPGPASFIKR